MSETTKNIFTNRSTTKRRKTKENLHSLWDVEGNIANKDEEKAEILNAFFASVFKSQTTYSQGT